MRIRATKPEFWQSETIAQLDWDTRLILKALESYVDDNGVGKDSVTLFVTAAFPHDIEKSPEIFAKVARSLSRLSEVGIIVRYSVNGERLVYVRRWRKWQYIDKPLDMLKVNGFATIELPAVAHKGPADTDARFFQQVAERMSEPRRRVDELSGSNVRDAVRDLIFAASTAARQMGR